MLRRKFIASNASETNNNNKKEQPALHNHKLPPCGEKDVSLATRRQMSTVYNLRLVNPELQTRRGLAEATEAPGVQGRGNLQARSLAVVGNPKPLFS